MDYLLSKVGDVVVALNEFDARLKKVDGLCLMLSIGLFSSMWIIRIGE